MNNYKRITMREFAGVTGDATYNRLAELEDKIENGELIDRDEYLDRLMAAKDISGMTDKELEFFAKHNARVRENADIKVCEEVVKECLQVLRDMRITYVRDDYDCGWNIGIATAIERLAEKYCIDIEED